jgi:hypothetical protein
MNPSRESIAVALFNLLQTASGFNYFSRRPQLWDKTPAYPALYLGMEPQAENYKYDHDISTPQVITLNFIAIIYINVGLDPNVIPDTLINNLLDSIDSALAPQYPSQGSGQTLGNLVHSVWISDKDILRVPGYLDGVGTVFVPIRVLCPQ